MRNLRKLFHRRRKNHQPKTIRRTRLPKADRGPVTLITVGPSDMIEHSLPLDTTNCWLVQYEGEGYRDWDRCWSEQGIRALVGLFRSAYPKVKVVWLKETKT